MHFSVIYEAEVPMDRSIRTVAPPRSRAWQQTERWDGQPSDWCSDLWDGKVRHRKWCGLLTRDQFEAFLRSTGLFPEDVETLGSLGAPGCGFGLAPAISFHNDDPEAIQSAYVTPLPDIEPRGEVTPERSVRVWRRVRRAMLNQYR